MNATTATRVRPMTEADLGQAARASAEAFELDISTALARRDWEERLRHSLVTDPEGSFVTERDGVVNGVAQAIVRDRLWILSLLTVSPTAGVGGEGRALVEAALSYGDSDGGIIIASNDARALRIYASSGFRVAPAFRVDGKPQPALLPDPDPRITAVAPAELPTLAPISRAVRGAEHTPDLTRPLAGGGRIFRLEDRGFVVTLPGRGVWALAAHDERDATALLWAGLHDLREEPNVSINFLGGDQEWALDVVVAARLSFSTYGAIATRGAVGPMYPYIPSPPFA
jgi:hypothetical protein